jgi:predicted nuclease of restriction endonuclease-like (RecB) superfamily
LRNPYLLEFLGLKEKPVYTETDLEAAIIANSKYRINLPRETEFQKIIEEQREKLTV